MRDTLNLKCKKLCQICPCTNKQLASQLMNTVQFHESKLFFAFTASFRQKMCILIRCCYFGWYFATCKKFSHYHNNYLKVSNEFFPIAQLACVRSSLKVIKVMISAMGLLKLLFLKMHGKMLIQKVSKIPYPTLNFKRQGIEASTYGNPSTLCKKKILYRMRPVFRASL